MAFFRRHSSWSKIITKGKVAGIILIDATDEAIRSACVYISAVFGVGSAVKVLCVRCDLGDLIENIGHRFCTLLLAER